MFRQALRFLLPGLALAMAGSSASACPFFFRPFFCYCPPVLTTPYVVPYAYAPQPYYVTPAPTYSAMPAYPPPKIQVEQTKPAEFAKPESAKPEVPKPEAPKQTSDAGVPSTGIKPVEFKAPAESTPLNPPRAVPMETSTPKPAVPDFKLDAPVGAAPMTDVPQLPAPPKPEIPQIPVPSPAKESDSVKIPPVVPPLRGVPDPTVPPLAIPTPAVPKSSTSQSSPLADRPRAEVVPVDGVVNNPGSKRTVGFYNRSDRDVRLTVEGETITLPKRTYIKATVPTTFAWKLDGEPGEKTTIPTASPGVEVVIRR